MIEQSSMAVMFLVAYGFALLFALASIIWRFRLGRRVGKVQRRLHEALFNEQEGE